MLTECSVTATYMPTFWKELNKIMSYIFKDEWIDIVGSGNVTTC